MAAPLSSPVSPAAGVVDEGEPQDLPSQIRRQVEFYFSDANMMQDLFLLEQMAEDPAGQGNVAIGVIASFKRMKRLTKDVEKEGGGEVAVVAFVAEALRQSDQLAVSECGTSVRRAVPLVVQDLAEVPSEASPPSRRTPLAFLRELSSLPLKTVTVCAVLGSSPSASTYDADAALLGSFTSPTTVPSTRTISRAPSAGAVKVADSDVAEETVVEKPLMGHAHVASALDERSQRPW